jgi:hypothetical protein
MIPRNLQITGALLLLALIAAAIYGVQLKRRDERNRQQAAAAVPVGGEAQNVRFKASIAFDDDGILSERELTAALPEEKTARARTLLRALLLEYMKTPSPHPIPQGSDVRGVYLTPEGLCVVDLNAAFVDGHRSGMFAEQFTLFSLIETLALNLPDIRQIKVLVEGKERPSLAGHADLSVVYDAAAVHAAVKEYARR